MAVEDRPKFEAMAMAAHGMFVKVTDEKTWLKEIGFGLQILRGSTYLQDVCKTPAGAESVKNAIANVALTGTTLNPALKKAYLVPRKVGGVTLCCLDISYIGLAGIAMDSGSVKHVGPRLVYSFDEFDYSERDGEVHITHKPNMAPPKEFCESPAKFWDYLVCGYVVAILHDGTKIVTQPLPKWKLEKAMKTSMTTSDKTPWRTHPDEMCLKTLVKHAYKLLPQTDRMSEAVSVLNAHEGLDVTAEKKERASDIVSRFEDATEAEALCPSCKKPWIDGACRDIKCDLGRPIE